MAFDLSTQWREDWSLVSVVSHTIVTDPTLRQPGFNLRRHIWSLMNCFQTGQCPCHANLLKWGLAQSPSCDCDQRQTMSHIVDTCPLTKFEGGLNLLHKADDDGWNLQRLQHSQDNNSWSDYRSKTYCFFVHFS